MKINPIRTTEEEKELRTCINKRHYNNYHDAFKAMTGTNLKYKTNCKIYTCPFCGLFAVGHKYNELQKEIDTWKKYIKQNN